MTKPRKVKYISQTFPETETAIGLLHGWDNEYVSHYGTHYAKAIAIIELPNGKLKRVDASRVIGFIDNHTSFIGRIKNLFK